MKAKSVFIIINSLFEKATITLTPKAWRMLYFQQCLLLTTIKFSSYFLEKTKSSSRNLGDSNKGENFFYIYLGYPLPPSSTTENRKQSKDITRALLLKSVSL